MTISQKGFAALITKIRSWIELMWIDLTSKYNAGLVFILGMIVGVVLSMLLFGGSASADGSVGIDNPDNLLRHIVTDGGLHCVMWGSGDSDAGRGLSCNWEDYNFQRYHKNIVIPSPAKERGA